MKVANEKVDLVLSYIRSDIREAKQCAKYGDTLGREYNDGLARGRLSSLYLLGLISDDENNRLRKWISAEMAAIDMEVRV